MRTCTHCARVKKSVSGRQQDGIRGDERQGAVTMALLETNCASRAVTERKHHMQIQKWELSMAAMVSPRSGSLVATGRSSTRCTPRDALARSFRESNAGAKTLKTEWNGCSNEQTSKPSGGSFFDTATRTATLSWSTPWTGRIARKRRQPRSRIQASPHSSV